jgi:thioredoxin 1
VLNITDETFEKEVLKEKKPVLVDFWAEWCGPCRIVGPRLEELSNEMTSVKFCKLNVDENNETAGKFSIRAIPTMLIFKNGEVVGNIVGALPKDSIKEKIKSLI